MLLISLLALASVQTAQTPPSLLTVTVQKLPKAFREDPVVSVSFNAKGAVASCTLTKTSGSPAIDKVACAQMVANGQVGVENGKVPAPREATVTFVQGSPQG